LNGRIEFKTSDRASERAWNYVTLGLGNDEAWWRKFCSALRAVGYDDVLSIEHEDVTMTPLEGVRRSVELLKRVIPS
jgi:sugar phosphate isomerase/epimerase